MKYLPKKELEHLMPEIGEKEKKTVISVVGKRKWDPSLGRWLFWEWTETWILVHGRETSFALWEVERWRREVDLINLQPAAVYYCLGRLLLGILLCVLKMFNTSQMTIFLMQILNVRFSLNAKNETQKIIIVSILKLDWYLIMFGCLFYFFFYQFYRSFCFDPW